MRTLGDIRETLLIKKFGSYITVKERHVAVSLVKIFCSDALTQSFYHCCLFCIFVYLDCATVGASDAFGVEIFDISKQITGMQKEGTDFLLAMSHTNQSDQHISE